MLKNKATLPIEAHRLISPLDLDDDTLALMARDAGAMAFRRAEAIGRSVEGSEAVQNVLAEEAKRMAQIEEFLSEILPDMMQKMDESPNKIHEKGDGI